MIKYETIELYKSKERFVMPFVHIELVEGRTEEQLTKMVEEVTEAVSRTAGAPKENIHVIINEMQKGKYAQGGKWK
jgi:4-oxalocrotonate tautomerase